MHAAAGNTIIQRAMNHYQNEELAAAIQALDTWQPLHYTPSEEAVTFRMNILRGKIFRFQGRFQESFECLSPYATRSAPGGLVFDEDLSDLICELADTLRELDNPSHAEQLIRMQLAREGWCHSSSKSLLKLSLAESLFAQGRFLASDEVCSDVMCHRQGLPKMGKLRLFITLAKLRHLECSWDEAFQYWTQALVVLHKFPPTSGLATRTIYLSTCDILRHRDQDELELATRAKVATLEQLSEKAEAKHWIAGLRHWLAFLELRSA